jgi:hypothetical protein
MSGTGAMTFSFPEIHAYWLLGVRQNLVQLALMLMLLAFAWLTMGQDRVGDDWHSTVLMTLYGLGIILSLTASSRQKKLVPAVNERFAVEFMLRTGYPPYPDDIDVLQVKRTIAVVTEEGNVRLWKVKRKGDMFTIEPA